MRGISDSRPQNPKFAAAACAVARSLATMITRLLSACATAVATTITVLALGTAIPFGFPVPNTIPVPHTIPVPANITLASGASPGFTPARPPGAGSPPQALPSTVRGTGTGVGHTWAGDGISWIGGYRLDTGAVALCLEPGKLSPVGRDYLLSEPASGATYSIDESARLAYIARTWALSDDQDIVASAALATWMITGLNGVSPESYAQRANGSAHQVLVGARDLLGIADSPGAASRGVDTRVSITGSATDGTLAVRADVVVDYISGGQTQLAAETVSGTVTLDGAVFADGRSSASVTNGVSVPIAVTSSAEPGIERVVRADAVFTGLPYGPRLVLGHSDDSAQRILLAGLGSTSTFAEFRYPIQAAPPTTPATSAPPTTVPEATVPAPTAPAPTARAPETVSSPVPKTNTPTADVAPRPRQLADTGSHTWRGAAPPVTAAIAAGVVCCGAGLCLWLRLHRTRDSRRDHQPR